MIDSDVFAWLRLTSSHVAVIDADVLVWLGLTSSQGVVKTSMGTKYAKTNT